MLHFISKSAIISKQLAQSTPYFKDVELQLLTEFVKSTNYDQTIEELFEVIKNTPINIYSIHTPLIYDEETAAYTLNDFLDTQRFGIIVATCKLAQKVAQKQGNKVGVVIHNDSTLFYLKSHDVIWNSICKNMEYILNTFPEVELCIENSMPVCGSLFRNGFLFESVEVVKEFREMFNTESIYTVLDICHAIGTIRMLELINLPTICPVPKLQDYFEANGKYTKIIHFNYLSELGMLKPTHSIPFTKDDIGTLAYIVELTEKHMPQAGCVLEVNEPDYINDAIKNKKSILDLLTEYNYKFTH